MQNLESRHKNELTTHFRSQERELEQLWTSYDRELEKLRSKLKQEADQKVKFIKIYSLVCLSVSICMNHITCKMAILIFFIPQLKQEASEERKFIKSLKDKQEADMKQFLAQQKAEFRATKTLYKRQLEDNSDLSTAQKKGILEERKKELIVQQKSNEDSRLQMLKTASSQELVEFRQKALQDRHSFEKGLLQEVRCIVLLPHHTRPFKALSLHTEKQS